MVRLKSRYILFEVLYPAAEINSHNCDDLILINHKSSPVEISIKEIIHEIRRSLQQNFGDYGYGKVNSLLQIKYFSNNTSTGIIRCHREDADLLILSLFYINKIGNINNITINPIKISGTIKKIEQYSIRRSNKLLSLIKKYDKLNKSDNVFNFFKDDFNNIEIDENDND